MEGILRSLQQHQNWKQLMRSSCRRNGLSTSLAGDLTILKLRQLDQRFIKNNLTFAEKTSTSWMENELRAFNWLLVALSAISNTLIRDFGEAQWLILRKTFVAKDNTFLRFEARKLIEAKNAKNKNWTGEEEDMLLREASKYDSDKIQWNEVAHRIFQSSGEAIFRSGKHCREHWLNYLDPQKQRGAWKLQDDIFLLQKVANSGKKWSEYAIPLKRTEHMVKNRYNSLLIKQKKLTPHIKKEQKLIKQLIARISERRTTLQRQHQAKRETISKQKQSSEPSAQDIAQKKQNYDVSQINQGHFECASSIKDDENQNICEQKLEQIDANEVKQQGKGCGEVEKADKIQVQNPLSNYSPVVIPNCDLNFFIKEDNKQMNRTVFSQYPIYSPYSPYIISPNTPSNYIPTGPYYVANQFYNYFKTFMSHTECTNQDNRDNSTAN